VGGRRWWNVKHPLTYTQRLGTVDPDGGVGYPEEGSETLTDADIRTEQVMLGIRLVEGIPVPESSVVLDLVDRGLVDRASLADNRLVLTRDGRLMADAVARALLA
jgi:oxygen-independent coproporphyrinogen-3 oxidase